MSKESVYFKVENIDGNNGVKKIKRGLDTLSGVISVSVNPQKSSLGVDFDNTGVKQEQIERKLDKLGYNIVSDKSENHIM